jgi:anti-sigma regulatory factor (Ser/Thr protein kinase)
MPIALHNYDRLEAFHIAPSKFTQSPCYFTLQTTKGLSEVLRRQGRFFIETRDYGALVNSLEFLQRGAPDFALALSSKHTYSPDTAHIITTALNDRFGMSRHKSMQILTCLQEALANAVIHGNLGIECERNSLEALERYYEMIIDAISDPYYADLCVYVLDWEQPGVLRICISHEGEGLLDNTKIQDSHPELQRRHGRGLFIIQSLAEWVMTDVTRKSLDITFTY